MGRPTLDETFDVLSSADRRFVLQYLHTNGATTQSTLAERLSADRDDATRTAATQHQRRDAAIRLHHVHVPKLVDANLVEPTCEDDLVDPTEHLAHILATLPVDLSSQNWYTPGESAVLD
ncbi:helix-turn-helix domain-containing protein [Halomarina salina]|uniref:Helix-turn-helix domain-containing protein n=1 Tax=Halomarina salina TaxID=1872699 RepID=A0ABD5RS44_9EURY|nr:helix-turn-helix domain-containing protein [Halomarina salina]